MSTLPLSDIVNVSVNLSPNSAIRTEFNLGLILGDSTVISSTDRVKIYTSLSAMATGGFSTNSPEYVAAQLYFSQSPAPSRVAVGRINTGETPVQAITACRLANSEWYAFTIAATTWNEVTNTPLVAAWAETATPTCVYFYTIGTLANITSVFTALQTAGYKRSIGQYSTTPYAITAIMGYAMGANADGLQSYDLAYKTEVGVSAEAITSAQLTSILAVNGNVYVNQGDTYNLFRQGLMANGTHFDEVLGLDVLVNDIQVGVLNALTSSPKIPQTNDGVTIIITAITAPLEKAKKKNFIAPGTWTAPQVLALKTGDTLTSGYLVQSDSISSQSAEDRAARKAPPIYVCIKLAGSIEFVSITLNVNR